MMDANDEKWRPVSEVAAEWFVRLKDGDLTATERREYLEWLKKSPEHIAEMLQISRTYGAVRGAFRGVQSESLISPEQANNIINLATRGIVPRQSSQRPAVDRLKFAAVFTMVVVSSLLALMLRSAFIDRTIQTEANEWRDVPLADGSMLHMGPRTRVSVRFGDTERFVDLLAGDAFFEVRKDPRRPFIVNAEPVNVRAIGTAFGVSRYGGDRVKVTVREGIVEIRQSGQSQLTVDDEQKTIGERIAVTAGQQASVSRRSWPIAAQSVDVERELAWLQRRLSFDRRVDTVRSAAEEFNRRNKVRIVVTDKTLADRTLAGVFDANDPESLVRFVVKEAGAVVVRDKPGVLRLEPRHESR